MNPGFENEKFLSKAISSIKDYAVIILDPDGTVTRWNEGAERIKGYQASEIIGKNFSVFYPPEDVKSGHPQELLRKAADQNRVEEENTRVRKDGSRFLADVVITAIRDNQGTLTGFVKVTRDITDRKKSEKMFRNLLELAPDAILLVDPAGKITLVNSRTEIIFGYDRAELLGQKIEMLIPERFRAAHPRHRGGFFASPKLRPMGSGLELFGLRKNGIEFPLEISLGPLETAEGMMVSTIIRDVTEEKQIRKQANLNDKLATIGTLAAGVAHEINNPLGYVLGNLEMLNDLFENNLKPNSDKLEKGNEAGPEFYPEIKNLVSDAITGAQRIRDIVLGLKFFSRNNGDELTEVNINKLLDSAISMTFHEIKFKARLERKYDSSLPLLVVNITKLQQVFVNMLINAANAIPPGNTDGNFIRVETGQKENKIFIRITDTGKGIPPEVLPRIFEPFFTTKPVGTGTGLGLSICHEIIRDYQGEIAVESKEGTGSTFTVWLPLENERRVNEIFRNQETKDVEGLNVLLVDDEEKNVQLFTRMLRNKHYTISTNSAADALKVLNSGLTKVDVIVSDLNMPNINGIEFYQKLVVDHPRLVKRVIFITGGVFDPEMVQFLESVPNPKLDKPFQADDLYKAISQVASQG